MKVKPDNSSNILVAIARGGSMFPIINSGDYIVVKKVQSYLLGDIILYKVDNIPTCHRIITMNKEIRTKGDNSPWSDNYSISREEILGRVQCIIKPSINKTIYINHFQNFLMILYNKVELFTIRMTKILGIHSMPPTEIKLKLSIIYWIINKKYFKYEFSKRV